jgi:hypothetical protein
MATANYSSWSGGNPPQQGPSTTATVVDTDPPESFSGWPNRQRHQPEPSAWPSKKLPQPRQRRPLGPAAGLRPSVQRPRRIVGWIVAFSLGAFAAGLAVAPTLSFYGDRGVEAAIKWTAGWAPRSLRAYLPKPIEETRQQRPPGQHTKPSPSAVVEPDVPSEPPVKHSQAHRAHGKHGSSAVAPTASASQASPAEKPAADPFEQ